MGEVLYFPERAGSTKPIRINISQPTNITPVEILEELLLQARQDRFVFLAVHASRIDGSCVHVEIADVDSGLTDPPEPSWI